MTVKFIKMSNLDLRNKRVLIREDLNAPMQNGIVSNDERIIRALPTIQSALKKNACVMILSHLGRPQEGEFDSRFSLAPMAKILSEKLGCDVPLIKNWLDGVTVAPGQAVLCENVRFNAGEKENNPELAKRMATLCDVFVMDAFAAAHRAHASTVGVAEYAPLACAGPLLSSELAALSRSLHDPQRPLVAIVGGSKVSTKFHVLEALLDKVNQLIVGGGIANTFLKAQGYPIGNSLYEPDWTAKARELLTTAEKKGVTIPLPEDVVVAKELKIDADVAVKPIADVAADDCIFDVGPQTTRHYPAWMNSAGTIVWNGPVGVFEIQAFSHGTQALGKAVAASQAYSIAGGGDTLAALTKFGIAPQISYISTGGGAFLEFLEGRTLPTVAMLKKRATDYE